MSIDIVLREWRTFCMNQKQNSKQYYHHTKVFGTDY